MIFPRPSRYVLACFALFGLVSLIAVSGMSASIDNGILQFAGSLRSPGMTRFMQQVSDIGDWQWEVPLALLVGVALRIRGRASNAFWYIGVCFSAELLNAVIKIAFHRARPTIISHLGLAGSYSFPSGHTLLAPIIWGLGLVLLSQLSKSKAIRVTLWSSAIVLSLMIALSRIYLGVHYPTDVLGGAFFGMAWVLWWWERVNVKVSVDPARA